MRLLHFNSSGELNSTDFSGKTIPPYAILSHTWWDDEFLFEDLVNDTGKSKDGYRKILFCNEQAAADHLQYFWVDTCCIDKWDRRELSDAINSMFRWYRNAARCYVFLTDVSTPVTDPQLNQSTWEASFRKSRWFARGWTLQELIAPASVEFFSSESQRLGDKESLEQQIHEITRIPIEVLRGDPLEDFSVEERKSWMSGRDTTQEEDMAYSLIGILGVSMDFRYGEGKERALSRLEEEVKKANTTPFIVPFDQNVRFVGREAQLAELEAMLFVKTTNKTVVITGPGGIGKTQLALELAYKVREQYKNCAVFWIAANDIESLHQAYTRIAQRINIPGWDDEKADVQKLVNLYLCMESSGQWLLIYDNVGHASLGNGSLPEGVSSTKHLPSSELGAIVFTTSDKKTAVTLGSHNIIELPEKDPEVARKMLEMSLTDPREKQEEADLLVQELSYLPLAIVQAAAYININKITSKDYLSLLVNKRKEIIDYGREDSGYEWQNCSTGNPIPTTWLISFEQIQSRDLLAIDYLLFMACIDRKDVPLALLPPAPAYEERHAVETLNSYSIITKRPAELALDLHGLVHLAIRNWLQRRGLLSQQTQVAITRLLEVFPDHNHENRSKWRRLLPHAIYVLSSGLNGQDDDSRTNLLQKCATTLYSEGRWTEAEELFVQVIETCKKKLGVDHPDTLTSMANLASTFWNQGRWDAAEELQVQVMETSKKKLGVDHPDTLKSIGNLASTFWNQGRWDTAEELEVQVMETSKKKLGVDHPDTLTSMNNLAFTWMRMRRETEAVALMERCVQSQARVLGLDHPHTLSSYKNLAAWKAE